MAKELLPLQINSKTPVLRAGRGVELRQHNVLKQSRMDAQKCVLSNHFVPS